MGWTSFNLPKGTAKEWFKKTWEEDNKYKVIDSALVNRSTMYGAIEKVSTKEIFCAVFLIRWSKGDYNFSYKDMTEHVGPNVVNCPKRIMELLTELAPSSEYAIEWRKRVQEYWNRKANVSKLANGSILKVTEAVKFTNGSEYQYFKKENSKRFIAGAMAKDVFIPLLTVRIRLNNYQYEVVR
jgi:hypothetical protein